MNPQSLLVGWLALCLATSYAFGQQPARLTLQEAQQRAIKNAPALARFDHLAGAAAQRVREARAGLLPSIAIVAAATDGPTGAPAFGVQGIAGDPLKKHYGAGLNFVQTLYDFGRTDHLVAARSALLRAAEQDTTTQAAQVLLAVEEAYYDVLRRQKLVTVGQAVVDQRQAVVTQAHAFVDAGLKADVDLQLARADLAEAMGELEAARDQVTATFAALNNAMGDTNVNQYLLDSNPPARELPKLETLMASALQNRPELKSAALQIHAADQSMRSARSDLLPRFDGIASLGAVNPNKLVLDNKDYAVGLAITAPIFTGGLVEGRIAEERERWAAATALQRETAEAIKLQVTRAYVNVQIRNAMLKATREQAAAATSSQQQAAERYHLQLNTIVEVTAAQAASARAETGVVNAEFDLAAAWAELDWATGAIMNRVPASTLPRRRK